MVGGAAMQLGRRGSQVVGVALGTLIFEIVRRQFRADTWDYGCLETAPGDGTGGTSVAVAFSEDDLRTVSRGAEVAGTETSQFIRDAALARAQSRT